MSFALELGKVKRTGFVPAFLGGGILAAAVPVLNMAFRSEMYISINASPVSTLLRANWQMMAMLNILLIVSGACIMYHTEYADNAVQRMCTLPIRESAMFFGKTTVLIAVSIMLLVIEAASVFLLCLLVWAIRKFIYGDTPKLWILSLADASGHSVISFDSVGVQEYVDLIRDRCCVCIPGYHDPNTEFRTNPVFVRTSISNAIQSYC